MTSIEKQLPNGNYLKAKFSYSVDHGKVVDLDIEKIELFDKEGNSIDHREVSDSEIEEIIVDSILNRYIPGEEND